MDVQQVDDSDRTSSSLLVRAKLNEPAAWERLFELYTPLVYHWCRRAGLQASDAENIVQEVLLKVLNALPEFRHDEPKHTFRGWIHVIARNTIRNHFNGFRPDNTPLPQDDFLQDTSGLNADSAESSEEIRLLYRKAVDLIRNEFSETDFKAFRRVVVDGQAPKFVAGELGVSVNVVYLARSRITKRVRDEFQDLIDGQEFQQ